MESSVERIVNVVQVERDIVKDLQAKLLAADAEKQKLQLDTNNLHSDLEDLRRQLNEAVAESKLA